jgi:iron complex outermembrane recepter protein
MRIAVVATAICLSIVAIAAAADAEAEIKRPTNIPPQRLDRALQALAAARGLAMAYRSDIVGDRQTTGASGTLTSDEALTQLLDGTGLTYRFLDEKTVTIVPVPRNTSVPSSKPNGVPTSSLLSAPNGDSIRLAQAGGAPSADSTVEKRNEGSSEQSSENKGTQLEEVVVTATRREESVEKVPISIVALSQADLAEGAIKSIEDIASVTPGLQFQRPNSSTTLITTISIRGLNTNTGASTVGIYLDDTPIQGRLSFVGNFGNAYPAAFDLNRVEVARGPQGTLFGAGSEAGTLRFITNQPSLTQFSGFSHAELASTQDGGLSYEVGAAQGGPIVADKVGFRVSVWDRHDGGYINLVDPLTGDTLRPNSNTDEKLALRAALGIQVADGVLITPSFFYQSMDTDGSQLFYQPPVSDPATGRFINEMLLPETSSDHFVLPSVKIEAHLPFASLTSTTSYMHRRALGDFDLIGLGLQSELPTSPSDAAPNPTDMTIQGITEEIRLASTQPSAFLSWVAGIFYDHRTQVDDSTVYSLAVDPTGASLFAAHQHSKDDQIAGFGQGDFHLMDQLTATLGLRVASVKTELTEHYGSGLYNAGQPPFSAATLTETPVTPRMALSYQADASDLFYVSAGKGFRVGGGNAELASFCSFTVPSTYKADSLWSYEIGAKNKFFDGRMQLDTSAFHVIWTQIQQLATVQPCGQQYTTNTGSAISNGFDLGLQALITSRLRLNLDVGYTDAYFTRNVLDNAGNPLVISGDKIGLLPQVNSPWNVNTAVNYTIPLPREKLIHLRGEYQYESRNPGPFTTQIPASAGYIPQQTPDPPTHLFNARVGTTIDKLDITLFVDNIFDSHPLLTKNFFEPAGFSTYTTFRPRTTGLSLNYAFGK